MENGVFLFQEPSMVASLGEILEKRTGLYVKGSSSIEQAEESIKSGRFSKLIVEPYIGCKKKANPEKLKELLHGAVEGGIDVLVYSTMYKCDLAECDILEGTHYKGYMIMPGELSDIIDYVKRH
jgi:hypothetical protein